MSLKWVVFKDKVGILVLEVISEGEAEGIQAGRRESSVNTLAVSLTVSEIMDEIRRQAGIAFPADIR